MEKTSQIAINVLLEKVKEKEIERDVYFEKGYNAQEEIDELQKVVNQLQGRKRRLRSDKGKKRTHKAKDILKEARKIVAKTKRGRAKQNKALTSFDKTATFRQKIVFVIKSLNRFVHSREIAESLHQYDSSITVEKYIEKLSAIASRFKEDGSIVSYLVGTQGSTRNIFYGLPGWLDENNKIKIGYEFDPKQVGRLKVA